MTLYERINPPVEHKWMLPPDLTGFVALLAQSPALGVTDRERLANFMALQQAEWMPSALRAAVQKFLEVTP